MGVESLILIRPDSFPVERSMLSLKNWIVGAGRPVAVQTMEASPVALKLMVEPVSGVSTTGEAVQRRRERIYLVRQD